MGMTFKVSHKARVGIIFAFASAFFLTQYQNCGPVPPEPVAAPNGSLGGGGDYSLMAVNSGAQNVAPCNQTTSSLQFSIRGGGPSAKACLSFSLTAPARAGETFNCDGPEKFVALSTLSDWMYDAVNDTWTTNPPVHSLKNSSTYIPGTYTANAMASDGTTIRSSAPFTLTNPSSPNNCN